MVFISIKHDSNSRLENYKWPVKLPENLPSCERCTFAWSWINAVGNREFYSKLYFVNFLVNCADVTIVSNVPGHGIVGKPILIANFPGYDTVQPPSFDGGPDASGTIFKYFPVKEN